MGGYLSRAGRAEQGKRQILDADPAQVHLARSRGDPALEARRPTRGVGVIREGLRVLREVELKAETFSTAGISAL